MATAEITGNRYTIGEVFSDRFVFTIPPYQRPYSWTPEHASALLDDLAGHLGDEQNLNDLAPYFLGTVVLIKGDQPEAEVVDGQQRLTTLTVLLSVLRRGLEKDFGEAVTKLLYEKADPLRGVPNRYRLTLRERDAEFFRVHVQDPDGFEKLEGLGAGLSDSEANVRDNAMCLHKAVMAYPQEQRVRLAKMIATRCYLVVVATPDFDSAYRIFTILNDRGLDLSHTDILKAQVVGAITEGERDAYTKKWEDQEETLGRANFDDLFGHIRTIFRKSKLKNTILKEIRESVKPDEHPKEFIDGTLIPLGDAFDDVLHATFESKTKAEEINRLLGWLHKVDNRDWVPFAVVAVSKLRGRPEMLHTLLKDLDRLAMGLMIVRANINERIERYGRVLSAFERGDDLQQDTSPLQLTAPERKRVILALDANLYEQVKIRLPVLLRLDAAVSGGGASYDYPTITVEHVLPQTPAAGSTWLKDFPDDVERWNLTNRLGNLLLLTQKKNSQARNFEFDRKKTEYFMRRGTSPFAITTQVLNEKTWNASVVKNRQEKLVEVLKGLWRL